MAYKERTKISYLHCGFHPYAHSSKIRKHVRAARPAQPSFADIEYEITHETPGVPSPTWLIKETGEAYAFVVQRAGLLPEEVEIRMEKLCPSSAGLADSKVDATLLSIYCNSALQNADIDWSCQGAPANMLSTWHFGRRFKLPADASPEAATAAHQDGILTVMVPRRLAQDDWFRVPLMCPPAYRADNSTFHSQPSSVAFTGESFGGSFQPTGARHCMQGQSLEIKWIGLGQMHPVQ